MFFVCSVPSEIRIVREDLPGSPASSAVEYRNDPRNMKTQVLGRKGKFILTRSLANDCYELVVTRENFWQYVFGQTYTLPKRLNELVDVRFAESFCNSVFRIVFSHLSSPKLGAVHAIDHSNLGVDLRIVRMAGVLFASSDDRTVEWNPPVIVPVFASDAAFVISVLFKEPT